MDDRNERGAWLAALVMPLLAAIATWVWVQAGTSTAQCALGHPVGGPGLTGGVVLAVGSALPVVGSGRRLGLGSGRIVALAFVCISLSAFLVFLAQGIWMIVHGCAA